MPMLSLSRKKFIDRRLAPDDLDDITDLWLAWHEDARGCWERLVGYHALELQLYGFPRQRGKLLKEELESRLKERRWDYSTDLSNPDLIRVSSPSQSLSEPCSLGDWLALVQAPAFCGLVAFLRLSLHDWPGQPEGPASAGNTLVLCGLVEKNGYLLKTIWPADLEGGPERLFELAVWPDEERFLQSYEEYRRSNSILPAPDDLFSLRSVQKRSTFLGGLVVYLHGNRGRLYWFLTRLAFHTSALALVVCLYLFLPPFEAKTAVCYALAVLFGTALFYLLSHEAARVQRLHRNIRAGLKKNYTQSLTFEAVDLAELGVKEDPNVVKYTAEVEALGCRHLADFRILPGPNGIFYNRLFVHPAENSYVFLNLMLSTASFQKFPAHVFFLITTYFDDLRLVTIHDGGGFRRPVVPGVLSRVFLGVNDPALLLAAHRKRVEQQRLEGHILAPLMNASAVFERMAEDHTETAAAMRRHGYYSWSAAVRQNFKLVRRELLGKIEDD